MIIWTSSIESDAKIEIPHMGIRSWRWFIELTWSGVEWQRQIKYEKMTSQHWRTIESKSISFDRQWEWKTFHCWYDGPHCAWSLGFLRIYWPRDNCKKCYYEAHDED